MTAWQSDSVDFACEAWAFQWVELFAREPATASQYLGRLSCTLDLVKTLHDGAGASSGTISQAFPEGFLGEGLLVACILQRMEERDREMLWRHYVERWFITRQAPVITPDGKLRHTQTTLEPRTWAESGITTYVRAVDRSKHEKQLVIERRSRPIKQQVMAERMGISRSDYHTRRDRMKSYVRGVLDGQKCLDTKVGYEHRVSV